MSTPTFALITKILDASHAVILHDWLDFLTVRPQELIVYVLERDDIYQAIDHLCGDFKLSWKAVCASQGDDLKNNEAEILLRMVKHVESDYLLFVNMDTLPFRKGGQESAWLQEVFTNLGDDRELKFFSGCGLIYQADKKFGGSGKYLKTQRFSNNFGLIRKDLWISAIQKWPLDQISDPEIRRYHSEWALEEEFRHQNWFGLRRIETLDWRVFHVQQWDKRLFKTRDLFHRGVGVKRYLNRVHEHVLGRWDYYYNYPKPPLTRRLRVWIGKYRRMLYNFMLSLTRVKQIRTYEALGSQMTNPKPQMTNLK